MPAFKEFQKVPFPSACHYWILKIVSMTHMLHKKGRAQSVTPDLRFCKNFSQTIIWVLPPQFFDGVHGFFTVVSRTFHVIFTHFSHFKMDQTNRSEKECFRFCHLQMDLTSGQIRVFPLISPFHPLFIAILLPKLLWDWANTVSPC